MEEKQNINITSETSFSSKDISVAHTVNKSIEKESIFSQVNTGSTKKRKSTKKGLTKKLKNSI